MGDRANILVKENDRDRGVYLYTHWQGTDLPGILRDALAKRWRWDDCQYLTRIIFDEMTENQHGEEVGFGISAFVGDGDDRILTVNCKKQVVSNGKKTVSFQEYIKNPLIW